MSTRIANRKNRLEVAAVKKEPNVTSSAQSGELGCYKTMIEISIYPIKSPLSYSGSGQSVTVTPNNDVSKVTQRRSRASRQRRRALSPWALSVGQSQYA
jgi:hypothetical protein